MANFWDEIKKTGVEYKNDLFTRQIYSVDASIYEVEPLGVIFPKTCLDIQQCVDIAKEHKVPITARGAATGLVGSCLGEGLIVDTSKYLNAIEEINLNQEYAICEPGVIQDQLNKALDPLGYRLGPDTSTGNRATLGGMVGCNAAGMHSLYYGSMIDHVLGIEAIISSSDSIYFHPLSKEQLLQKQDLQNAEGVLYKKIAIFIDQHKELIKNKFPKIKRRSSGYNLDRLLQQPLNLANLFVGSEGSLGIITKIKTKIVKKIPFSCLCILHFESLKEAFQAVPYILEAKPTALELIDHKIIEMGKISPALKGKLDWLKANPKALLIVEFESEADAIELCKNWQNASSIIKEAQEQLNVWALRKAGLGLLLSRRSYSQAIAFLEDVSIPLPFLNAFVEEFQKYLKKIGKEAGIYGHVGEGCLHIRPFFDLRKEEEVRSMQEMMQNISDLVLSYKGSLSGEHGDGYARSFLNAKMFGQELYYCFCELKQIFDPQKIMNPHKIVEGEDFTKSLRISPTTKTQHIKTFLSFEKEGGFELAADLCNGNGQCRKKEGIMCPSFQPFNDEFLTTRARAQSLRAIIHEKVPLKELWGDQLYKVLDFCLECKGCKKECPSQVDMAKMKAEVLYQYQLKNGADWRSRFFAYFPKMSSIASYVPSLSNQIMQGAFFEFILDKLGIVTHRSIPLLSPFTFSSWWKKNRSHFASCGPKVALFNDTYTQFYYPQIGISAVKVLHSLGFQVEVLPWKCCGKPLISKGFLKQARKQAQEVIEQLNPFSQDKIPIISLEPSCNFTLRDDFYGLVPNQSSEELSKNCFTIEEFILLKTRFLAKNQIKEPIFLHGHCHQKSLIGNDASLQILKKMGRSITCIESSCCGLAGSFGYEKEHDHISSAIAESYLYPFIRNTPENSLIVANGFSCRCQIKQGTSRSSLHIVHILEKSLI